MCLDSAQAGELFEEVFTSAYMNPETIEDSVDYTVSRIRDEIREVRESSAIYGISEEPDAQAAERLRSHPLPHWVERMTAGHLNSHGGKSISQTFLVGAYLARWAGLSEVRFTPQENEKLKDSNNANDAKLLNLENSRIRGLAPQSASDRWPSSPTLCRYKWPAAQYLRIFGGFLKCRLQGWFAKAQPDHTDSTGKTAISQRLCDR